MKYEFCEKDFVALLAENGYTLEKYQTKGVFDSILGTYYANDSEKVEYIGVTAWTTDGNHKKVKIDILITCKSWENLHAFDEEPDEFFHEIVNMDILRA